MAPQENLTILKSDVFSAHVIRSSYKQWSFWAQLQSLEELFAGQDAVVSTLGFPKTEQVPVSHRFDWTNITWHQYLILMCSLQNNTKSSTISLNMGFKPPHPPPHLNNVRQNFSNTDMTLIYDTIIYDTNIWHWYDTDIWHYNIWHQYMTLIRHAESEEWPGGERLFHNHPNHSGCNEKSKGSGK